MDALNSLIIFPVSRVCVRLCAYRVILAIFGIIIPWEQAVFCETQFIFYQGLFRRYSIQRVVNDLDDAVIGFGCILYAISLPSGRRHTSRRADSARFDDDDPQSFAMITVSLKKIRDLSIWQKQIDCDLPSGRKRSCFDFRFSLDVRCYRVCHEIDCKWTIIAIPFELWSQVFYLIWICCCESLSSPLILYMVCWTVLDFIAECCPLLPIFAALYPLFLRWKGH